MLHVVEVQECDKPRDRISIRGSGKCRKITGKICNAIGEVLAIKMNVYVGQAFIRTVWGINRISMRPSFDVDASKGMYFARSVLIFKAGSL